MDAQNPDFQGLVASNVLELIGKTPIVRLNRVVPEGAATVWAKLERNNPASCVKERIALSMIEAAEGEGKLHPGDMIVEATSGNTGIGLAMVAAVKGYQCILVMPDSLSVERRVLFKAYGAKVVLSPGSEGMKGSLAVVDNILAENPGAFFPSQFENPANPEVHRRTTASEILAQVPDLDAFVGGVGTGGTITGVGSRLKADRPGVLIVAVEPATSAVISGNDPGKHGIQGIGAGFIPAVLDRSVIDEIETVETENAKQMARDLARKEGLLVGISSGAAVYAAVEVAKRMGPGKQVVTLLPDTGERYLSTGLYD